MKRILESSYLILAVRVILGFIFIVASIDKAADPNGFAVSIGHYKLVGPTAALVIATILPWIELLCGIFLVFGIMPRGSSLLILLMLVVFTGGVVSGIVRGLDISCGCFTRDPGVGKIGWMKVLENCGLILLGLFSFFSTTNRFSVADLSQAPPNRSMKTRIFSTEFFQSDTGKLAVLSFLTFSLHVAVNASTAYGYFRDEFYYLACSEHLAFGYVDQPPFSIFLLAISRVLFGDSLVALRLLPAVAAGVTVFLTGRITAIIGGAGFAQILAALCVAIAPQYLGMLNFYSMNAFDLLFWTIALYTLVRIIKENNPKLWLVFGIVAGLGAQNKFNILFLCFGIIVGMLLTTQRKQFMHKSFWVGAGIAILIFLPHIIWQLVNNFPTAEFVRNATLNKNVISTPIDFLAGQIMMMSPFTFPVWATGLLYFFFSRNAKPFRLFGWCYVSIFVLFVLQNGKPYYLSPVYPILYAGGSVAIAEFCLKRNWIRLRTGLVAALALSAVLSTPFALPLLPPETFISYAKALGIESRPDERHEQGKLPQHYADMFGWKEKAEAVARAYKKLTPEEQAKCAIFTFNYGRAGAIDFFGKEYGLPKVISNHNNYWLWGPRGYTGEVVIILAKDLGEIREQFKSVELEEVIPCEYCMPYEADTQVYICRGLKTPIKELWQSIKSMG